MIWLRRSGARTVIRFSFCHLPSSSVKLLISHKTGSIPPVWMQTRKTQEKTVNWVLSEGSSIRYPLVWASVWFVSTILFVPGAPVSVCDCYDPCGRCLWSRHGYANTRPPHNPRSGETPALLSSLGAQGRHPDKIIREINIFSSWNYLDKPILYLKRLSSFSWDVMLFLCPCIGILQTLTHT